MKSVFFSSYWKRKEKPCNWLLIPYWMNVKLPQNLSLPVHLYALSSHFPYFSPLCSDIWALGCVLYEMCTLKHAVSILCVSCLRINVDLMYILGSIAELSHILILISALCVLYVWRIRMKNKSFFLSLIIKSVTPHSLNHSLNNPCFTLSLLLIEYDCPQ